ADECQLSAVGRKGRLVVVGRVVSQAFESAAVSLHAIEIRGAVTLRGKHDECAIRRPRWVVVGAGRGQERMLVTSVRCGDKEIELAGLREHARKHDLLRCSLCG